MELRGWIRGGTQQLAKVKIPDSEWGSARRWRRGMRALGSLSRFCPSETPRFLEILLDKGRHSDKRYHRKPLTPLHGAGRDSPIKPLAENGLVSTIHTSPAGAQYQLPILHPGPPSPYLIRAWSTLDERREAKRRASALGDVLGLPSESPLSSSPMALM